MEGELLDQAIVNIRAGNNDKGRQLLWQLIEANPENASAWLWLAACAESVDKKRQYLERVLAISPDNWEAKEALDRLPPPPVALPTIDEIITGKAEPPSEEDPLESGREAVDEDEDEPADDDEDESEMEDELEAEAEPEAEDEPVKKIIFEEDAFTAPEWLKTATSQSDDTQAEEND